MLADSLGVLRAVAPVEAGRFLEAGCGPAAVALNLARDGWLTAGVDRSDEAVSAARSSFGLHGLEIDLRIGDVRAIPWEDASFDLLYAGGVVEHFRDTERALDEFRRVLSPGGVAVITVPALTLSWPYLSLRGNVPAVPVIEDVTAFVQFRMLRGRLAAFGYERSFTRSRFAAMLRTAGFDPVSVSCYDTYLPLPQLPERLRPLARRLARHSSFCPMWCGIAVRPGN